MFASFFINPLLFPFYPKITYLQFGIDSSRQQEIFEKAKPTVAATGRDHLLYCHEVEVVEQNTKSKHIRQ